ncbi:MAG TPA: alpha/beta fold hydrolase [Gammaproteobacteria bacterium]|nr:alpha/beta fold hydrolase [Gammaproteobacteria bacterium]
MATLDRSGVSIYYEVHGSGPVILLSHGYSATSQMWRGQIETLTRNHRLVLWDMRGHGRSDSPEDPDAYSEALTVDDMAALLDEVDAEQALVGGLSLGGYMSLAFHLAHPERVRALMVIDTGPGFRKDTAREDWNRNALRTGERLESMGLEALQGLSREMATSTHRSAKGLALAARGMLTQRDARVIDSLPHIAVPTLIVVGANDEPFLPAAEYMNRKIPDSRKVVIPNAGHAVNLDRPEPFNRAVAEFLAKLDGA